GTPPRPAAARSQGLHPRHRDLRDGEGLRAGPRLQARRLSVMEQRPRLLVAALAFVAWGLGLFQPLFGDDHIHLERSLDPAGALGAYVLRGSDSGAWWSPADLAIPYFRPL